METFTLGEARSAVTAQLWTADAISCLRSRGKVKVLVIGIDNAEDYQAAACLGIDAVLVDSPHRIKEVKQHLVQPLLCR